MMKLDFYITRKLNLQFLECWNNIKSQYAILYIIKYDLFEIAIETLVIVKYSEKHKILMQHKRDFTFRNSPEPSETLFEPLKQDLNGYVWIIKCNSHVACLLSMSNLLSSTNPESPTLTITINNKSYYINCFKNKKSTKLSNIYIFVTNFGKNLCG